ncbi:MAG: YqgE/AlgH family protein [Bacteroidota bacterium]|uniref:Putative transcriptional regulator n=1 Tax=Algoriphagus faecimaris TaxID=686796 RepID=A0A1G6PPJ1_9BACT|nr:YqgE/AlgH family protein [Algoriphagus faecimaris]SDC81295.1 putative transcriptional regulator [Algoriphagus faecimaris]
MSSDKIPDLSAGDLLISEPFLLDENFTRSVVLLCEHNAEGSFGLILNKPSILKLAEIMDRLSFVDKEVYVGGPVEQNTLHYIYQGKKLLEESIQIGPEMWWGGNFEELALGLQSGNIDIDDFRFFLGYSGWAPDQLKEELIESTWIVCQNALDENTLSYTPDELWRKVLLNMGGDFKLLANYPLDPRLN